MKNNFIKHITYSIENAENYKSKLPLEILSMNGMSGKKTRHFYNNMGEMNDCRYLEIGTWTGSSISSFMYKNTMTCIVNDNFSQFNSNNDVKQKFLNNFNAYKGQNNAQFIESDCWNINPKTLSKFNMYLYDGEHSKESHYKALNHFLPCLENTFIYIIDDWNIDKIREGTLDAIKDNNLIISYKKEIRTSYDNTQPVVCCENSDWHNGICIFVLEKKIIQI
tara:strand:+ start:268 stop:933 length:666 start_codon:yes stop_codon:yes gene_type:complete